MGKGSGMAEVEADALTDEPFGVWRRGLTLHMNPHASLHYNPTRNLLSWTLMHRRVHKRVAIAAMRCPVLAGRPSAYDTLASVTNPRSVFSLEARAPSPREQYTLSTSTRSDSIFSSDVNIIPQE